MRLTASSKIRIKPKLFNIMYGRPLSLDLQLAFALLISFLPRKKKGRMNKLKRSNPVGVIVMQKFHNRL